MALSRLTEQKFQHPELTRAVYLAYVCLFARLLSATDPERESPSGGKCVLGINYKSYPYYIFKVHHS